MLVRHSAGAVQDSSTLLREPLMWFLCRVVYTCYIWCLCVYVRIVGSSEYKMLYYFLNLTKWWWWLDHLRPKRIRKGNASRISGFRKKEIYMTLHERQSDLVIEAFHKNYPCSLKWKLVVNIISMQHAKSKYLKDLKIFYSLQSIKQHLAV